MDDVCHRVLELAWAGYQRGCVPIGAAVTDPAGMIVAEARNRLLGEAAQPGQLSNSRVAHAEVNALAQLPAADSGGNAGYRLTSSVDPCCLCMGAVIVSGVGALSYLWADAYAGAASSMTLDNPQARRRRIGITGPGDPAAERVSGLLIFCHYRYVRPSTADAFRVFALADPGLDALARAPEVASLVAAASRSGESLDALLSQLEPYLA
jgi:tRNA(Arg) A34 adenosine deaminase TadA